MENLYSILQPFIAIFYPIVKEEFKSHVGMQFNSLNDAFDFYTSYLAKQGFGVQT